MQHSIRLSAYQQAYLAEVQAGFAPTQTELQDQEEEEAEAYGHATAPVASSPRTKLLQPFLHVGRYAEAAHLPEMDNRATDILSRCRAETRPWNRPTNGRRALAEITLISIHDPTALCKLGPIHHALTRSIDTNFLKLSF